MSTRRGTRGPSASPVPPSHHYGTRARTSASAEPVNPPRINRGSSAKAYGEDEGDAPGSGIVEPDVSGGLSGGLRGAHRRSRSPTKPVLEPIAETSFVEGNSPLSALLNPFKKGTLNLEHDQSTLPEIYTPAQKMHFSHGHEGGLQLPSPLPSPRRYNRPSLGTIFRYFIMFGLLAMSVFGTIFYGRSAYRAVIQISPLAGPYGIKTGIADWTRTSIPDWTSTAIPIKPTVTPDYEHAINKLRARINELEATMSIIEPPVMEIVESRKRVNVFALNLGTVVDPYHTSPTISYDINATNRLLFWFYARLRRSPLPPVEAITPWNDIGDCWCAARSTEGDGRLSIGFALSVDVIPRGITVEHLPRGSAITLAPAPKRLQLWVRVAAVSEKDFDSKFFLSEEHTNRCEGPYPDRRENWVCLHTWNYNIYGASHIQRSLLPSVPFAIDGAVVRVIENNGNDFTCLYRLKMDGHIKRSSGDGLDVEARKLRLDKT